MNYQNTRDIKFYTIDQSQLVEGEDNQEEGVLGAGVNIRMKDPIPSNIKLKSTDKLSFNVSRNYAGLTYILNVRYIIPYSY